MITIEHLHEGCKYYHDKTGDDNVYAESLKLIRQNKKDQIIEGCLKLVKSWNAPARVSDYEYLKWLKRLIEKDDILKISKDDILKNFEKFLLIVNDRKHLIATIKVLHILHNDMIPVCDRKILNRYHKLHEDNKHSDVDCFRQFVHDIDEEVKIIQKQAGIVRIINICPICSELNLKGKVAIYKLLDELNMAEWTYPHKGWLSGRVWHESKK